MLKVSDFMKMLISGADKVIASEEELTDIDSKFGDADHGITMRKIMVSVKNAIGEPRDNITFEEVLDLACDGVMQINGGSAVPLWSTLFEGMMEAAPEVNEIQVEYLKAIFKNGYTTLHEISKANVGDKTMMDALIPAVEAIMKTQGDEKAIMTAAAEAAEQGAEASKAFVSKFGRAKSYKEATIGTPDAGATSMKYFFIGMNEGL